MRRHHGSFGRGRMAYGALVAVMPLVAAACGSDNDATRSEQVKLMPARGNIVLTGAENFDRGPDLVCLLHDPYIDLGPNAPVTISDRHGTILAVTSIDQAIYVSRTRCQLNVRPVAVPAGKGVYLVKPDRYDAKRVPENKIKNFRTTI